ncbi:glycosyltransferase family 4 protein [Leptospira sp. 201903074]|nr:glycosyltransferase family 1 protein [Leptospira abararensis]MBM9547013.1 glycosyltransferase family 4 protein [Leptospira abararensis]
MNLIFDISVLAWSIRSNKAKTGIFRVIENLFFQFLKDPEINLYLTSIHGNIKDLNVYLKKENIEISEDRLLVPQNPSKFKDKLFQIYLWTYGLFDIKGYPRLSKILLFFHSIFVKRILSIFGLTSYFYPVPRKYLTDSFIFHSTFLPIPEFIQNSKIRKVITIYDLISILHPKFFIGNQDHVVWKLVRDLNPDTKVITISEHSKRDLLEAGIGLSEHQVFVTPLAPAKHFYQVSSKQKLDTDLRLFDLKPGEYILSVATLEPRKNLKATIHAFLQLSNLESNPNLKLVLLGGRGWGENLEEILSGYSDLLKEKIVFLGFVSDESLASLYSGAKFFVYLSFYEGFGLPPLEAMCCGVPVLVSNASSLPEVVGDAGLYVDPYDLNSIKTGMEKLLNEAELRKSLSSSALKRSESFTWEKTAKFTKEAYLI